MIRNKKILYPLILLVLLASVGGGWLLWREREHDHAGERKAAQGKLLYTCPMHPFIIKDRPGACPICGMELVRKLESAAAAQSGGHNGQADMPGHVSLSESQRVMANVATVEAWQQSLNKEITASGIVQFDQSRQAKVTSWIAGRIDRLNVNSVAASVSRNRPVAELYSPELVATQLEYLLALKSRDQLKDSPIPSISQNGEGLVASARQRLLLFGVRESQIAALEKAGKPNIRLPIYTPLSGVVIEKMVQQGQYVNVGDVLFTIADLSTVWIELDIYEPDLAIVRVGQRVEIHSPSFSGGTLSGRIALVNPFLDPRSRTVKARVEMANPGMRLKPDMFVSALIRVPLGTALVVPVSAVIDSGKRRLVWVESSPGMFEPRQVQVGQQAGDRVQILSGLREGEKVAVSGGYLIDSEAQLKSGTRDQGAGTGGHQGHGTPAPRAPVKKDPLSMDDMKM
ncbi:efflux RND transporter periplasmic adaptor subunit [Pelobacter propionicus]|uniref:Efflux transporter, RND family, MFP subunit n=1 Tax=Pelobacter propionicus (strain DSM 2379 / NBRC 103807 / OttBd1) TaxID=338966 RepID=A1AT55_PELPD|nr:efflux RND transporter periplasmic adaptor subunit [Pelobacter propionicus]ABL00526.1 efflux transporter, RND family, MFP subunit [Pelobacter propionicus DSM 2379]